MILNQIDNARLGTDQVDKIYLGNEVVWQNTPPGPVPYEQQYLTFGVLSDGDIVWAEGYSAEQPITIEYSKNDGPWTQITSASGSSAPVISVVSGDTVRFRGDNLEYIGYKQVGASQIPYKSDFSRSTCTYNLYGNMMSMIDSTGFTQIMSIPSGMNITNFFAYQGPVDASNMVLPATTLAEYCYQSMFQGCTSLTTAPALPATTLAKNCYMSMFESCTSLTTAPSVLPATTLADSCYESMFSNCTSLTTAPALPATTLTTNCYSNMFGGCTSLTTAPELPATTLVENCYGIMFSECTSLDTITCLATNPNDNYTSNWVMNVASTGTFVKKAGAEWETGPDGIPSGWTVEDAS